MFGMHYHSRVSMLMYVCYSHYGIYDLYLTQATQPRHLILDIADIEIAKKRKIVALP